MKLIATAPIVALLAAVVVVIVGCGSNKVSWEEEARQSDGRVLLVKRTANYVYGGEIIQLGSAHGKAWSVRFEHPLTKEEIFFSDHGDQVLILKAVEVSSGTPYIVVEPSGTAYDFYDCPAPPYVIFRYVNKEWQRISINELPAEIVRPNLIGALDSELRDLIVRHHGRIPETTISEYYASAMMLEYSKKIVRKASNPIMHGCHRVDDVYGKGTYLRIKDSGTWLDKSPQEIEILLRGKEN